ncbi:muconolactone Delta-isomerase family protein [Agromyces silvae]|uniref:muconolactone Delta-isomerase family protein n=1 Tax=Agromyces silvae TaxID=3388266 RepID=UPI00280ADE60|nr:muconolactone Delta-isomerase family protein [Agromyces protaetiae]
MDFLVETTIDRARFEAEAADRTAVLEAEQVRAAALAAAGLLLRLWRPADRADEWCNLGLWRAQDADALRTALESLPLAEWMAWDIRPLTDHPNDPRRSAPNSGSTA